MMRLLTCSHYSAGCALTWSCSPVFGSVCPSRVGQLVEWYDANRVFGFVYMAVVAFSSLLAVPTCSGRSVGHPHVLVAVLC